jgi:hypothetical protein
MNDKKNRIHFRIGNEAIEMRPITKHTITVRKSKFAFKLWGRVM